MTVREDRIKRASGAEGIYGVVEKPHFVIIVPYEDGKVHLVEQYRYPVGERFWEFPQGSWEEKSQEDHEKMAMGELREETGLIADTMIYVGFQYEGYGFSNQGYHIYFATGFTRTERQLDVEEEDLITRAFPLEEFEAMLLSGQIKDTSTTSAYCLAMMKNLIPNNAR